MEKLRVFDKFEPVWDSFHFMNLIVIFLVENAKCHNNDALLFLAVTCHEMHEKLIPKDGWLQDLHGKLGLLVVFL